MKKLVAILALLALISGSAHGAVLTFQNGVDGYGGGNDTAMYSDMPVNSYPLDTYAYIAIRTGGTAIDKALYRFDLSSMAGDYTDINSISLTLNFPWGTTANSGTVGVFAISTANAAWGESTASWANREQTGGTPWAGSAGLNTATTDYDATALASWSYSSAGAGDHVFNLGGGSGTLKDLIDLWSVPATNAGLVLAITTSSDTEAWAAHTGYVGGAATHPLLTVDYEPAPIAPGDTNDDGNVDGYDLTQVIDKWGMASPTWADGDVWHSGNVASGSDGFINQDDYDHIANVINPANPAPTEPLGEPIPEPATLGLLLVGALAVIRRRY